MKYLSVCSGIEAATVAWHHLGWTPVECERLQGFPDTYTDIQPNCKRTVFLPSGAYSLATKSTPPPTEDRI